MSDIWIPPSVKEKFEEKSRGDENDGELRELMMTGQRVHVMEELEGMEPATTLDDMDLPDVIALTGMKSAGKSSGAKWMVRNSDRVRLSFAERPRKVVMTMFGIERKWLDDPELKETEHPDWGITPRTMLRRVAMSAREKFGKDIWSEIALRKARSMDNPVVIDDLRFLNEARLVREEGGVIIGIERPGHGNNDDHPSEAEMRENWDQITDRIVINDEGIGGLFSKLYDVLYDEASNTDDESIDLNRQG